MTGVEAFLLALLLLIVAFAFHRAGLLVADLYLWLVTGTKFVADNEIYFAIACFGMMLAILFYAADMVWGKDKD
jgi:hypothetical protein